MKKKFITLCFLLTSFIFLNGKLTAQTNWKLAGNNLAGTEKLGSLNNFDLRVFTDNIQRMTIRGTTGNGRVGIGPFTTAPLAKLHINTDAGEDGLRVQINSSTKLYVHNGGGVSVGSASTPPTNGLYVSGNVGLGVTSPTSKLQIAGSINFDGEATGITFDDGQFIRDGAASLDIESHGNLVPDNDANHTLGTSAKQWSAVWAIDGSINLVSSNTTTNVQDLTYGIKEIMKLRPVSYNLMNNPEGGEGVKRLGLLANEMKPILPEAVRDWDYSEDKTTGKISKIAIDKLGVNMDNIIPVLIKGMQEQEQIIQKQQQEIKAFEDRLTKLEASVNSVSSNNSSNSNNHDKNINGASLQQNQPNPFNQNTTIRYTIPANTNAQIMIYDASGRLVKTLQATQSGQAQINGGDLKAGTYRYTLLANGNLVAAKTMVLLK